MSSTSIEMLISEISSIINQLKEKQDQSNEQRVKQLEEKLLNSDLSIALCGHFSAGKSTLINTLCGAKLLPSSPIPTSANIVTLMYGDVAKAEVEIIQHDSRRQAIVPIEQLAHYCVDGESYSSIKIKYPSPFLKQGIQLLDTPGIDSTDDGHRLATESALHLADVVFYVMDYNHVQSEINFSFAKQLKEWGKPLFFIVNQIDKHRDEELSFEAYQQSVWQAFEAWHLEPAGIVYLSMKVPEHPEHQWQSLQELSRNLVSMAEPLKVASVQASLQHVMVDHLEWQLDQLQPSLEEAAKSVGGKAMIEAVKIKVADLEQEHTHITTTKDSFVPQFRAQLDSIIKNANITPATLRDKMALMLESRKPGFKQGILFTKGKTEAEQEARLLAAYKILEELVQSNLTWHVQQLVRDYVKPYALESTTVDAYAQKIGDALPEAKWLVEQISTSAVFGNEYTIIYCTAIADGIKRKYRDSAIACVEQLVEIELKHLFTDKLANIAKSKEELLTSVASADSYFAIEREYNSYTHATNSMLAKLTNIEKLMLPNVTIQPEQFLGMESFVEKSNLLNIGEVSTQTTEVAGISQVNALREEYNSVSSQLDATITVLNAEAQLSSLVERLQQKTKRLKEMNFTISLFGAFSAGKSSLANALIGEAVLPVSPNPTTATINSILPSDASHPHNTATIYMKTEKIMLDDLVYSLKLLGLYSSKEELDQKKLFDIIDKIKPNDVSNSGRAHYSFVKAARKGWSTEGKHLGQAVEVSREQYVAYVAEESLSCFVQEIKFYYDCPLTSSGIVLVDTPGADSVNARHTGVAFNYIKNTDAIIFVTYYNHAFSHADRQFLDQLGRVKDQFELDKMFFVVNAADLATTEEELQGVLTHVRTNLEVHQIKHARLYPISSIMALEAKQNEDSTLLQFSGMGTFEQQFYSFIQHELGEMVLQAAKQEHSVVKQEMNELVQSAKRNLLTKDTHIAKLKQLKQNLKTLVGGRKPLPVPEALGQEIEQLTYYIVQRIQLRFTDFYNYAFNPASIKEEGHDMQQVLYTAWLELERSLSMELKQELLATTLRIEKFTNRLVREQSQFVTNWIAEEQLATNWSYEYKALIQPIESEDWTFSTITKKWLWQYFKSAKHFFEQQGKQQLRGALEPQLFSAMKEWMDRVNQDWQQYYNAQYSEINSRALDELLQHYENNIDQAIKLLEDTSYLHKLEQISSIINKH